MLQNENAMPTSPIYIRLFTFLYLLCVFLDRSVFISAVPRYSTPLAFCNITWKSKHLCSAQYNLW